MQPEPLLSELSRAGAPGHQLPRLDVPEVDDLGGQLLRVELPLPEIGELDVIRHFTHLAQRNFSIDSVFYPLGSCTMKYNPRINEDVAHLPGIAHVHPLQPDETAQGALRIMFELQELLAEITGFSATTLQPAAGAQGELTGMLMMRAYHLDRGDTARHKVLVPDSAHGTNPATAAMCGFESVPIASDANGNVDLDHLRSELDETVVGLMLTNPSTLGLFEQRLPEVTSAVHAAGGLVYGDGANLNAILGVVKPAEVGFDCLHINLHKTFSTPHGSGGPGAGPVAVNAKLEPFLPVPVVDRRADGQYALDYERPRSIGRLKGFHGHFGILARALTYIRMHGADGLRTLSETAVLNANYLRVLLADAFDLAYERTCMHEFVLSGRRQKLEYGVKTLDVAKRLLDFGIHPPTIYFPLIVDEAIMVEPTEGESRATLDHFAAVMRQIARECEDSPEVVRTAPHHQVVGRLDEVTAARKPILRWPGRD
ncbi:MAG: aminomethyl-transferring glycine dehydrogenase subunit GcvPB [Chloroflexi bacterium]|nr:aminomethyl-transferring glycine dehydrogenase subunit GcvPB [Chloroflexota bacterium]MBV9599826.1 aminomethyl-transferring glycine dehydrogenase subunit GcvPB [Chloroflexota bacterium]